MKKEKRNETTNTYISGQNLVNEQKIVIGGENEETSELDFDSGDTAVVTRQGRGKKKREVALVFDRYYEKAPRTALLLAARVLFCCALSVCSMMFVLNNFDMPIDLAAAGWACFGFTAAFSVLFLFVRKLVAIPIMALAAGLIIWQNFDAFQLKLSYFIDAMILQVDGRLLQTRELISHKNLLTDNGEYLINPNYGGEIMFGVIILCALFSLLAAATMFRRPHILPLLIVFLAMWAPRMIAERMLFNGWFILAAALYVGAAALTMSHRDGLAIRHGFTHSYHKVVNKNEHVFDVRVSNAAFVKRVGLRNAYSSKYFSLAVCCMALFLASGLTVNALLGDVRGINYTDFYEFIKNVGSNSPFSSPFSNGPMSQYFTTPNRKTFTQGAGLSITSPGTGEQEVLRVKHDGAVPIYLRGDIGIDFNGDRWTSPVTDEPEDWNSLRGGFRPAEALTMRDNGNIIDRASISVDYLCNTPVVFIPAYNDIYDSFIAEESASKEFAESYTVHGDYAIRTAEGQDRPGNMVMSAYTYLFEGVDGNASTSTAHTAFQQAYTESYYHYSKLVSAFGSDSYYKNYRKYVYDTYQSVPGELSTLIHEYIDRVFGSDFDEQTNFQHYTAEVYEKAVQVADYLRDNYEYSLNAPVDESNPIISFLNDTKSGHCALYASAMTMIMRCCGIPARYCTGFAARPNGGAPQVLRSKNLHAWCEVYLDNIGWVTFDPTSSVSVEAAINGTPLRTESSSSMSSGASDSSDSSREISSSTVSSDESGEGLRDTSSGGLAEGEKLNILPYILGVFVILAAIALIVFIIYRIRKFDRDAKKALKCYYGEENSQNVYERLLAMLKLCKLTPSGGELTAEFFKRSGKAVGCNIAKRGELLELVAFGKRELTDTEKASLGRLLENVFYAVNKKLGPIGKTRLRFIVLSKRVKPQ